MRPVAYPVVSSTLELFGGSIRAGTAYLLHVRLDACVCVVCSRVLRISPFHANTFQHGSCSSC